MKRFPQRHLASGQPSGFTLLELLIALILGGILLGAVWTSLDLFWRLSETGREEADQLQLSRAVFAALQRDLRSVMQPDAGATGTTSTSTTSGGTSGTSSSNTTGSSSTTGSTGTSTTGSSSTTTSSGTTGSTGSTDSSTTSSTTPVVPPLLVGDQQSLIFQAILPQTLQQLGQQQSLSGTSIIRRDRQWVGWTSTRSLPSNLVSQAPIPTPPVPEEQTSPEQPLLLRWQADLLPDGTGASGTAPSTLPVPPEPIAEVQKIQLRYFDGTTWQETWDSDLLNGLPRAIEIQIDVASVASLNAASIAQEDHRQFTPQTRTFRKVIPLPMTTLSRQPVEE